MKQRYYFDRAEGQAIVLAALVLIVLIAMVGLALDGANAFSQRRNANNAADSAAMAGTRALIDENQGGGTNSAVLQAIQAYLDNHLPIPNVGGPLPWEAYYIRNDGQNLGAPIPDNSDPVPDLRPGDPAAVGGVSVELHYTFNTYFMPVMGYDTLTVEAYGMAFSGPLGSASGAPVAPLAIFTDTASDWYRNHPTEEWTIALFADDAAAKIRSSQIKQISLKPGGASPTVGPNTSGCDDNVLDGFSASDQETLGYWWCRGAQEPIVTGADVEVAAAPLPNQLKNEVSWRIGQTVLFPVYIRRVVGGAPVYSIGGFLAVRLTRFTGAGNDLVAGQIVNYYISVGQLTGNTNGVDFGTYAINLVR